MAKYCGNCGAQMADSARVCGNCGTHFGGGAIKVFDPEKKKARDRKTKRIIKLCVGLVVLALVAVLAFQVINKFTGYNGLVRKVMTAYEEYDIEALVDMSSDMYYYGSDDYAEYYFENAVGYELDYFESEVGHNYKLSYEVDEIYTLSRRNMDTILDDISWMYSDFDVSMIEQIVVANITVTARQGSKSVDRDLKITMSKEEGTWKVLYID